MNSTTPYNIVLRWLLGVVCRLMLGLILVSCSEERAPSTNSPALTASSSTKASTPRWYLAEQVQLGSTVFSEHCADCHGDKAQGLVDNWKIKLEDGHFPPPPLNGSAHAWHHPLSVLVSVINEGGQTLGGAMPSFANTLSEPETLAAIAYFQSYWNDEIYENWIQMGGTN